MTVTHVSACRVKGCPAPKDPDFHHCWCGANAVHHHHVRHKGMGGSKEDSPIICLCPTHHEGVHTGGYKDEIVDGFYVVRNQKGQRIVKHKMLEGADRVDRAEVQRVTDGGVGVRVPPAPLEAESAAAERAKSALGPIVPAYQGRSAAAPPASGKKEEGDVLHSKPAGAHSGVHRARGVAPPSPVGASSESSAGELGATTGLPVPTQPGSPAPPFNKDTWCQDGMQLVYWAIALRDARDEVRFKIGDWFNEGEGILSDEAYGYLRGFEDVTVRQYSWVAGRVSPDTRVAELSWSHARAVAALEPPKQREWLEKAQEENLSSKGLYQAIHGEKPRVKRWSFDELEGYLCHACRAVVELMEGR